MKRQGQEWPVDEPRGQGLAAPGEVDGPGRMAPEPGERALPVPSAPRPWAALSWQPRPEPQPLRSLHPRAPAAGPGVRVTGAYLPGLSESPGRVDTPARSSSQGSRPVRQTQPSL